MEDSGCKVKYMKKNMIKFLNEKMILFFVTYIYIYAFQEVEKGRTANEINDLGGNIFLKLISYGRILNFIPINLVSLIEIFLRRQKTLKICNK